MKELIYYHPRNNGVILVTRFKHGSATVENLSSMPVYLPINWVTMMDKTGWFNGWFKVGEL